MSYIAKKVLLFETNNDVRLRSQKTNAGELRFVRQCTDLRSWHICDEERRHFILDVIKRQPKTYRFMCNCIPIGAVVNILSDYKQKGASCKFKSTQTLEINSDLSRVLGIYQRLHLTDAQRQEVSLKLHDLNKKLSQEDLLVLNDLNLSKIGFTTSGSSDSLINYRGSSTSTLTISREDKAINVFDKEKEELKLNLAAKEKELEEKKKWALSAIKEMDGLKTFIFERERFQERMNFSKIKIDFLYNEKVQLVKAIQANSRNPALDVLEADLAKMREESENPDREIELIHKELEVLKCYCDSLSGIHQENIELHREIEYFKKILEEKNSPITKAELNHLREIVKETEELHKQVLALTTENDNINEQLRITTLEKENLYNNLELLKGIEQKYIRISKKADQVTKYEKQVKQLKNELNDMAILKTKSEYQLGEINNLQEELKLSNKIIANVKSECEIYKEKLKEVNKYIEDCQNSVCRTSLLQYELEKTKKQLDGLSHIKIERDEFEMQARDYGNMEKDLYEAIEVNQVLAAEIDKMNQEALDKDNVIMDQEVEIRKLILKLDTVNNFVDNPKLYESYHECLRYSKFFNPEISNKI